MSNKKVLVSIKDIHLKCPIISINQKEVYNLQIQYKYIYEVTMDQGVLQKITEKVMIMHLKWFR